LLEGVCVRLHEWAVLGLTQEMALWLESKTVARDAALLRRAQGIDLDLRLQDYGLKRYNRRPDPYARQLGLNILFTPKGTLYAVSQVADLLLDTTHLVQRSGRNQYHLLLAFSRPLQVTPTYWSLADTTGQLWYLYVRLGALRASRIPPPGFETTPPGAPLTSIQLQGTDLSTWYLALQPGGGATVTQSPGSWGASNTVPFQLVDDTGLVWTYQVNPVTQLLIPHSMPGTPTTLLSPQNTQEFFALRDDTGTTQYLWVTPAGTMAQDTSPPGGTNVTPGGGPYDWLRLHQQDGTRWALAPLATGRLQMTDGVIAGRGTTTPVTLGVSDGSRWRLGIGRSGTLALSDDPPVSYQQAATCVVVLDTSGTRWFWRARPGGAVDVSPVLWPDTIPVIPLGEVAWYQFADAVGTVRYLAPSLTGVPLGQVTPPTTTAYGVLGTFTVRDTTGQQWVAVMNSSGQLGFTQGPQEDLPIPDPVVLLRDIKDVCDRVQAAGTIAAMLIT
jgi:hypothetical protein